MRGTRGGARAEAPRHRGVYYRIRQSQRRSRQTEEAPPLPLFSLLRLRHFHLEFDQQWQIPIWATSLSLSVGCGVSGTRHLRQVRHGRDTPRAEARGLLRVLLLRPRGISDPVYGILRPL